MADGDDFDDTGLTSNTGLAYNTVGRMDNQFDMGADDYGSANAGPAGGVAQTMDGTYGTAIGDAYNEDVLLSIPAFANDENRALNEKLIARNRELSKATSETLEHQERIAVMQEHLKNVRLELANAQKVLAARDKEVKTEDHLNAVAERAVGRMKQDLSELDKRGDLADSQLQAILASIQQGTEKLEAFKAAMNWKQEELEKWAAAARAKEDDALALEKYTRADEALVKERSRELERLSGQVTQARKELEAEAMDAAAKQVELDALADSFKTAHAERASLLNQWQESLRVVEGRDKEIAQLAERFADTRVAVAARRERINDGEKLFSRLESENKEMERVIDSTHRQVVGMREGVLEWTERLGAIRDKVEVLQFEVQGAAQELVNKRGETEATGRSIESRQAQTEAARGQLEAIKARKADAVAQAAAVHRAVNDKEAYLKAEEARVEKAEKELAALRESQFRAGETVAHLQEQERVLLGSIAGSKRTRRNLEDRLRELDAQATKQAEHIYSAEFQIQQMERKVGRAKGEVSEEEKVTLQGRIAELKSEAEEVSGTHRQLEEEQKTVKQALASALRRQAALGKQLAEVQARIDEALLQTRSGEEALKKAVRAKEEGLVSHDLLLLQVKRLRDALSSKTEAVYSAENRAAQLALSIEARKREIAAHMAVQRAQRKLGEEERHKLALDLAERTQAVNLLRTKYEMLCARLRGGGEGEGGPAGEPRSQAYYVLKAAQKREELQREGDELDALCKKCEKEVRALASTLGYLNDRNEVLRKAFTTAGEGSDEVATVQSLEQQAKDAQDALFRKKRELASLHATIQEAEGAAAQAGERAAALHAQVAALEAAKARADAEREAQGKIVADRAAAVTAAREKHRARRAKAIGRPVPGPTADEVAFHAQGIKEASASALYTLGQLARELPGLKSDLTVLLAEQNLRMPVRPPSQAVGMGGAGLATAASRGATAAALAGVAAPIAASPITVPPSAGSGPAAPVAGSALQAIRARPGSAQSAGQLSQSGKSGGGASSVKGGRTGTAGGKQAEGPRAASKAGPAGGGGLGLELGLMGKGVAAQTQGGPGKPPSARPSAR